MSDDIYPSTISITHRSERDKSSPADLRILHYNDVYHIEPGSADPCGGISRFQEVVSHYRFHPKFAAGAPRLITLFSGDAFNPSLESTVTKGRHMVSVLNTIGTDAACIGNHDLDFGVPQFQHLSELCRFPWLLANVLDPDLGEEKALGDCKRTTIIESSNGIKIGLIGLGEREWLDTINSLPPNLIYKSASETAKELIPGLRAAGAEIIIALTHQRDPNDFKLAEKVPAGLIDIILGGHDHHYTHEIINGCHVLCSGSDFKQLSYIEATRKPAGGWNFDIIRHDIGRTIKENEDASELVRELTTDLRKTLEEPIGYTAVPLDGRFSVIRIKESNLGNFVCDLMRFYYGAECTIMASGTIRGDQVYPPGVILLKDILNCFPFEDPVMVIRVTGQAIVDALENAVSKFPAFEGRFPQVSNIQFAYNPKLPPYKRVLWTKIHGDPVDLKRKYVLSTRGYMGRGKDGYTSLLAASEGGVAEEIVSEEQGVLISTIIRQYFMSLKVLGQWAQWGNHMDDHWSNVHTQLHAGASKVKKPGSSRDHSAVDFGSVLRSSEDGTEFELTNSEGKVEASPDDAGKLSALPFGIFGGGLRKEKENRLARKYAERWRKNVGIKSGEGNLLEEHTEVHKLPSWTHGIAPTVEGRIVLVEDGDDDANKPIDGRADRVSVNVVDGTKA